MSEISKSKPLGTLPSEVFYARGVETGNIRETARWLISECDGRCECSTEPADWIGEVKSSKFAAETKEFE